MQIGQQASQFLLLDQGEFIVCVTTRFLGSPVSTKSSRPTAVEAAQSFYFVATQSSPSLAECEPQVNLRERSTHIEKGVARKVF